MNSKWKRYRRGFYEEQKNRLCRKEERTNWDVVMLARWGSSGSGLVWGLDHLKDSERTFFLSTSSSVPIEGARDGGGKSSATAERASN